MSNVKDFLNPNSMLTPGIAGSITMMVANALWMNFGLPPKYTALVLCLLLGLVVLAELKAPLWQKSVYYIINVLIIFSVSVGSNSVGVSTNQIPQTAKKQVAVSLDLPELSSFFIRSAKADSDIPKQPESSPKKQNSESLEQPATTKKPEQDALPPLPVTKTDEQATPNATQPEQSKDRAFFQSWF